MLVTGAAGFVGSHLCARLVADGARVRGLVRYNSRGDRGALDWLEPDVADSVEVVAGDVRDVESVAAAVAGVRVVFHLAAQIAIPYSYVNPRDFFETNVIGTLNVAQACLDAGTDLLVHTSTSEVYGSGQTAPITESHPLEPQSPYAASKVGADKLIDSFRRTFGLRAVVLRPFNAYGPHQSARAVIPTVITQALAGDELRLGALDTRRDLTYVEDTVAGYIAAAASEQAVGRTLQLATGSDASVAEIVETVGDLLGRKLRVTVDEERLRPPSSEVAQLLGDPAAARELTGWQAMVSLRDGLARTIEWIDANPGRFRVGEYAT